MLASWGFLSVMPQTDSNNEFDPAVVERIRGLVDPIRGQELSAVHDVLAGVSASDAIAFVGHSRGCGRMQDTFEQTPALREHVVASIFLGPHGTNFVVPGLFLVIGATEDGQSLPVMSDDAYARQAAPRWKIIVQGGNHSLFSDHKVYHLFDGEPSVTRTEQLRVVVAFTLPLLQRAFGHDEPFAAQLDTPPSASTHTVTHEL